MHPPTPHPYPQPASSCFTTMEFMVTLLRHDEHVRVQEPGPLWELRLSGLVWSGLVQMTKEPLNALLSVRAVLVPVVVCSQSWNVLWGRSMGGWSLLLPNTLLNGAGSQSAVQGCSGNRSGCKGREMVFHVHLAWQSEKLSDPGIQCLVKGRRKQHTRRPLELAENRDSIWKWWRSGSEKLMLVGGARPKTTKEPGGDRVHETFL